jgi:hypothetical protein
MFWTVSASSKIDLEILENAFDEPNGVQNARPDIFDNHR